MKTLIYAGLSMLLALLAISTAPVLAGPEEGSPDLWDTDDLSVW